MRPNYRALLAAVQRPGWHWNPWRSALEHEALHALVTSWELERRGIRNEDDVNALLRELEGQERSQLRTA